MNILHTADWHLGKKLATQDRHKEHELFIEWLLTEIEKQEIDMLLISGDVFDVTNPPNFARKMYYDFLLHIKQSRCKHVIITGGNHDSVSTLDAPREILKHLDIYVIGGATEEIYEEVIPIHNEQGEVEMVVCAVPFLRDNDLRHSKVGESFDERVEATKNGIINHYEQVYDIAKEYKKPILAMGHLFARGSETSDSEREIHVGNLGSIVMEDFPTFDYVALGHIHRPQILGGNEMVRYSGSPIHLSFSEKKDVKSVCLVKLEDGKLSFQQKLEIPNFRKLIAFKGTFEDICEKIEKYEPISQLQEWAEVHIEEETYDPTLIARFEEFKDEIEHINILKFTLKFENRVTGADQLFDEIKPIQELQPSEVFEKLLDTVEMEEKDNAKETFLELFNSFNELDQK